MPAKCVSSVSPRFHYRRLAFCFLPLAAILEFRIAMMLLRAALRGHRKFLEEEANLALNLMFLEFLFTAMASSLG
jgi:hypothetical protein